MKHSFSVFLMLILVACQTKKNKITFYIENGSRVDTIVTMNVWVEGRKVVDTNFVYSTITPNYDIFIVDEFVKDSVLVEATVNTGVENKFKIKFDRNAYIFLAYVHDSLITESEVIANEQMKKELNGYDPSVLLEKKAIREKVQYTQPLLY